MKEIKIIKKGKNHLEGPRLGIEWELQLLAYTTATGNAGSELCL